MILGNVIVFGSTGDIGSAIVHKIAPISKSLTLVSRQKPDGLYWNIKMLCGSAWIIQ